MERLRALWAALNRERTVSRARRRSGRRSRSGVALLLVITTVAMMTVLVTEIVHGAAIRLQLATNQRDEAQAEALAMGGVQFYRLLLIASKQLEGSGIIAMAAQFGIPTIEINPERTRLTPLVAYHLPLRAAEAMTAIMTRLADG